YAIDAECGRASILPLRHLMSASGPDMPKDAINVVIGGGVKRTWPIAVHMSACDPKRTLMLQNHLWECSLSVCSFSTIRCPILTVRDDDEAARVHHASQLRGGDLAARCPRAAV